MNHVALQYNYDTVYLPNAIYLITTIVMIVVVIVSLKTTFGDLLINTFSHRVKINATLISKNIVEFVNTKMVFGDRTQFNSGWDEKRETYVLNFKLENDKYKEFTVDKNTYEILQQDKEGVLDFKGKKFRSFM